MGNNVEQKPKEITPEHTDINEALLRINNTLTALHDKLDSNERKGVKTVFSVLGFSVFLMGFSMWIQADEPTLSLLYPISKTNFIAWYGVFIVIGAALMYKKKAQKIINWVLLALAIIAIVLSIIVYININ